MEVLVPEPDLNDSLASIESAAPECSSSVESTSPNKNQSIFFQGEEGWTDSSAVRQEEEKPPSAPTKSLSLPKIIQGKALIPQPKQILQVNNENAGENESNAATELSDLTAQFGVGSQPQRSTSPTASSKSTKAMFGKKPIAGITPGASSRESTVVPLPDMKVMKMKMMPKNDKSAKQNVSASFSAPSNTQFYRYKIMPGNNSRVVMFAMKKRPWWHAILGAETDEDLGSAQPTFLWEMIRRSVRYKTNQFHNCFMNHIQRNIVLVTKKGLYLSLKQHCQEEKIDLLSIIPRTFYLAPGTSTKSMKDDDLEAFLDYSDHHAEQRAEDMVWIMKPASKTNRGFGIKVVQGKERVMQIVQRGVSASSTESTSSGNDNDDNDNDHDKSNAYDNNPLCKQAKKIAKQDGYIVQAYLERPLLVHGRKFDIRCFVLVTVLPPRMRNRNGGGGVLAESADDTTTASTAPSAVSSLSQTTGSVSTKKPSGSKKIIPNNTNTAKQASFRRPSNEKEVKAYFFNEAYIRTSCKKYTCGNFHDRETHLTNDAVQKHASSYGKFEEGNKLSLQEFEEVLLAEYPHLARSGIVMDQIFPQIKRLSKISIASVAKTFQQTEIHKSFELFGYDYMIREDMTPVLIEVNTNPCLEFVCPLLTQIITDVIEHTVRMTVDREFPPPPKNMRTKASEEAIADILSTPVKFEPLFP